MRGKGILPTAPNYLKLLGVSDSYRLRIGFTIPKPITLIRKLFGLSPGTITLFHDADSGFFTDARAYEGAPPVYHHVTDEVAGIILEGRLTHELEAELMKPDEYLGE
jgi:hypothetical protein